jgi:SAM-dependent methyltransferase
MDLTEIPGAESFTRHPWEVVLARFFAEVLRPLTSATPQTMLDVGAGDGWFASVVAARQPDLNVTCFDPGYEDIAAPPAGPSERVEFVATRPDGPFDVITVLDVLEHVPDDFALLSELTDALRPGGHLLISVPAWPALFSSHDVALRHERRYAPAHLSRLLEQVQLTIVTSGGLFHTLLVARAVNVALERIRPPRHEDDDDGHPRHELSWRAGPRSHRVVTSALETDARFGELAAARGWQIPGLSWWALCRRPS